MGKPIQKGIFSILIFLMTFSLVCLPEAEAQVMIQDENSLEIVFSTSGSLHQKQSVQLGPDDLAELYLNGQDISVSGWNERADGVSPFYVENEYGETAAGGLKPVNSPANRLFYLSFENETPADFTGFNVAFDLLYQPIDDSEFSFQLRYRIENGNWHLVPGAVINSSMLTGEENRWNSISIQATLDDIYIRNNEKIDFEWISESDHIDADLLPIAFQYIELFPERFQVQPLERGDLIITEILPATEIENDIVEFVEIYNPTEKMISLKGLVIQTPTGSETIRNEITLAPNSFTVFSNPGAAEYFDMPDGYEYHTELISDNSGYVELYLDDRELAKATYDRSDPEKSLELNHVVNAFDGYTSLQHFEPSSSVNGNVSASPGGKGNSQRLFVRDLKGSGWHFISSPGLLEERLSRSALSDVYSIREGVRSLSEIQPNEPLLIYLPDEHSNKIYSYETIQPGVETGFDLNGLPAKVITVQDKSISKLGNLTDESNRRISPVYLMWNVEKQNFDLLHSEDEQVSPWIPLIVHEDAQNPAQAESRSGGAVQGPQLNRYINLRLIDLNTENSGRVLDNSLVGFLITERGQREHRYDLPKLMPVATENRYPDNITLMHVTSGQSSARANSFTHLPFEPDQEYQVGLGITTSKRTFQAALDWSDMLDVPEEWKLILVDKQTGREIDMTEQSRYEFRMNSAENYFSNLEPEPGAITSFEPAEEERFSITIRPFETSEIGTTEEKKPGSVELRQNYPNPFNPSTNIVFYLPEDRPVKVGVYNIVGQQVALLADENLGEGEHTITWNASEMPSGVYIVQLEVGSRIFTRKITLIK